MARMWDMTKIQPLLKSVLNFNILISTIIKYMYIIKKALKVKYLLAKQLVEWRTANFQVQQSLYDESHFYFIHNL